MKRAIDIRRIIIFCLIAIICILSIGYATLAHNLTIEGSSVTSNGLWDIKIISIDSVQIEGNASNSFDPKLGSSNGISFGVNLESPGDSITYTVVIKNQGNIDAVLKDVVVGEYSSQDISRIYYEIMGVEKNKTKLPVGATNVIKVKIYSHHDISLSNTEQKMFNIHFIYEQDRG